MHIVVVEDDWFERELMVRNLNHAFSGALITQFKTGEEFLLWLDRLEKADVVVMEQHLPLLSQDTSDIEEAQQRLSVRFNRVISDWEGQKAGERLVRLMREYTLDTPVVIYTHSDKSRIALDILEDPRVAYCQKRMNDSSRLTECVRRLTLAMI